MYLQKFILLMLIFCSNILSDDNCSSSINSSNCSTNSCDRDNCNSRGECNFPTLRDCFVKTCIDCNQCDNVTKSDCCDDRGSVFGKTFYSIRPQDSNTARRILYAGNNGYESSSEDVAYYDDYNARAAVTLEYQKSFCRNGNTLSRWFSFNGKNCKCMTVGIPGNNETFDINAIELGITSTVNSATAVGTPGTQLGEICLTPRIKNFIADFDFKFDLECFCPCSWARLNFVVAHCQTNIGLTSNTFEDIAPSFPQGFICSEATPIPFNSVLGAFEAQQKVGDIPPMLYGRFVACSMEKTKVAGVHFELGYDFVRCERGHVGVGLHVVAPTGNRPQGRFLFEPIIGANKSWQLGVTVNASYDLYYGCCDNRLTLFFDSIITHLFKARQYRPFQLKNGPGSEFLILKKFDSAGQAIGLERAANILHGETRIGAGVMFDGSLMLQYRHCNFYFDLGYNLWIRSREERANTVCLRNYQENTYGLINGSVLNTDAGTPLCEPGTIVIGSTNCIGCTTNNNTASKTTISTPGELDTTTIFIKPSDIDFSAPLHPRAISNKIFAALGYQFECCCRPMFVSVGGEVEFGQDNKALNQWGVLGQFGISF